MANKSWMKTSYRDPLKHGRNPIYWEVSRSVPYPHSSEKQDAKKYKYFTNALTGFTTIGKVGPKTHMKGVRI